MDLQTRPAGMPVFSLTILVLLCLSAASSHLTAQAVVTGTWEGTIEVPGSPLSLELELRREGGEWSGTYSIPMQGIDGFTLENISIDESTISFELGGGIPGNPSFDLELSSDGKRMAGSFSQGGATLDAYFDRAGSANSSSEKVASLASIRDELDAFVDSVRVLWDVPGLSISIVRGDESVTLVSGVRNIESGKKVTSRTQFPIGSTTKAFTATLLGTLVEEGMIGWDDRVVEHLPDFRLSSSEATASLRVRDLLTHTSGLPRHDLLWYLGTDISRDVLFSRLRYLEPTAEPHQKWQYQNLMYLVAGLLAERVTGESWEELMRDRILVPLGMTSGTTLDIPSLERATDAASGHSLVDEVNEVVPYRPLPAIAPAGAINASAESLIPWLRMNLEGGTYEGERIIGEETMKLIHSPQTVMPGGSSFRGKKYALYGFGWMVSDYRGETIVYHGGGIDGFVAQVTLMPEEKIGVAVMTNRPSGMPEPLALDLIDIVRGEEPFDHAVTMGRNMNSMMAEVEGENAPEVGEQIEGTEPSHDLSAYTGLYAHPAYDTVRVTQENGRLHIRYFGIEAGLNHYHYDVFELDTTGRNVAGVQILFNGTFAGTIGSLAVPLEPTIDPIEFEKLPDPRLRDPEFLAEYTGEWLIGGQRFEISERAGVLSVSLPGQAVYSLAPEEIGPDGRPTFRIDGLAGFRVRFAETEEGLTAWFIQPNGTFRATKVK